MHVCVCVLKYGNEIEMYSPFRESRSSSFVSQLLAIIKVMWLNPAPVFIYFVFHVCARLMFCMRDLF